MGQKNNADVKEVTRWETKCCGFLFNLSSPEDIPSEEEPMTGEVRGVGKFLIGDCPGCNEKNPRIKKISE